VAAQHCPDLRVSGDDSFELLRVLEPIAVHPADPGDKGRVMHQNERRCCRPLLQRLIEPLDLGRGEAAAMFLGDCGVESDHAHRIVIDHVVSGLRPNTWHRTVGPESRKEEVEHVVVAWKRVERGLQRFHQLPEHGVLLGKTLVREITGHHHGVRCRFHGIDMANRSLKVTDRVDASVLKLTPLNNMGIRELHDDHAPKVTPRAPHHRRETPARFTTRPPPTDMRLPTVIKSSAPVGNAGHGSSLSFSELGMTFPDGTEALRDITFDVSRGEFVTVVGPSGCGKSTLLRVASGLLDHTSGDVEVDRKSLGYTFQDATLLPWRSVLRNVELLLELEGMGKEQRRKIARQHIDLVGLTGFENHYPKRLSGGMKMRVSLARSLAAQPDVFMFDEPFGALDEITRERLNDELLALFVKKGFAGLFITHSIYEAVYLSTRVLVMSARPGEIVASYDVPFDYPREPSLRYDPEFAKLSGEVSACLRASTQGAPR